MTASSIQRVLVTGAGGFVGSALMARLANDPAFAPTGLVRRHYTPGAPWPLLRADDLGPDGDWRGCLGGVDIVVHAAARVHLLRDNASEPLAAYRRTNTAGTLALARQAAAAGVGRFVFLSTIKVNGERTGALQAFTADDAPAPADPYAMSKYEAEQALFELGAASGMEIVVIRPPLVYGPGVKANMLQLMRWLARGIPLPFGSVRNRRSLIALGNLVDLVACCLVHRQAGGEVFLASDGEDLSTADLLRRTAAALGTTARLVPVPPALLRGAARLAGRGDVASRLLDSLVVDIAKTRQRLNWSLPLSVDNGLAAMARDFRGKSG